LTNSSALLPPRPQVLLSIPPAFTGLLARSGLGPLSKIYRQATQEAESPPAIDGPCPAGFGMFFLANGRHMAYSSYYYVLLKSIKWLRLLKG
jgi:hypothetical protein